MTVLVTAFNFLSWCFRIRLVTATSPVVSFKRKEKLFSAVKKKKTKTKKKKRAARLPCHEVSSHPFSCGVDGGIEGRRKEGKEERQMEMGEVRIAISLASFSNFFQNDQQK